MKIEEHISLKELTTLKIGGAARYFCAVKTGQELRDAFAFATEKKVPVIILGGGSNILISSDGVDALVLKIEMRGIEWIDEGGMVSVIVRAGENWDELVAETVKRGLWGIENLSGIPGTVGAAPIQNIGAYGTEVKEAISWVEVFDTKTAETKRLVNKECAFGYRDSVFKTPKGKQLIVTSVALRLKKTGMPRLEYKDLKTHFAGKGIPTLDEIRSAVLIIRSGKFPNLREFGTAGSFFKNPIISIERFEALKKDFPDLPGFELKTQDERVKIKVPLAWILDNICSLKGYHRGAVTLFAKQPIVLVHSGLASSEEIEAFAKEIFDKVKTKTGIEIEWEVQKI